MQILRITKEKLLCRRVQESITKTIIGQWSRDFKVVNKQCMWFKESVLECAESMWQGHYKNYWLSVKVKFGMSNEKS